MSQSHPIYALLSHPGLVRRSNEDCAEVADDSSLHAFVVCDGMGGAAAGEVASHLAASTFLDHLTGSPICKQQPAYLRKRVQSAIHAANSAVYRGSRNSSALKGMGTTLVSLIYFSGLRHPESTQRETNGALVTNPSPMEPSLQFVPPSLWLANVGDSRCYLFRRGELIQLTTDHSIVQEQVRAGQITSEEAILSPMRNLITRAIGSLATVEPDIDELHPLPEDLYLLASDGLTLELSDQAIAQILRESPVRPTACSLDQTAKALIDAATRQGGRDNVTVLLVALP